MKMTADCNSEHGGQSPVRHRAERGVALWEFALILPLVLLVGLGVIDFGRYIYFSIEVEEAARAAALFGAQNPGEALNNSAGIAKAAENAAPDVLAPGSSQGLGTAMWTGSSAPFTTAAPYYGCECPGSTSGTAGHTNCTGCTGGQHEVYYVAVTAQATYKTLVPWGNFGSMGALWKGLPSTYTMQGYAKIRLGAQ